MSRAKRLLAVDEDLRGAEEDLGTLAARAPAATSRRPRARRGERRVRILDRRFLEYADKIVPVGRIAVLERAAA